MQGAQSHQKIVEDVPTRSLDSCIFPVDRSVRLVPNLLDPTLEILHSQRRLNTSICFNVSRSCKELLEDGCEIIHRFDPGARHLENRTHVRDPGTPH